MIVQNNPFLSHTFVKTWCEHFIKKGSALVFNFISIPFHKPSFLPLYVNAGSTLTKGVSYELFTEEPTDSLKNKALLIFDVPRYFKLEVGTSKKLGLLKVRQYPGYLIQLNDFTDLNDYLSKTFSKSSNQKFKRYQQRLEQCFTIDYKVYHGAISKEAYERVFNSFYHLLTKRFDDKQTVNNNLFDHEWNFYHDVVYQMILEKKASLYVIYSDQKPISVRLNYYSDEIIFDAITVFDIDYSKFHLGKISIMKVLEWAFENNYKQFDFSKGYFDYKESWGNLKYDFEYHILYNKKSLVSIVTARIVYYIYKLKQYLRDQRLNEKFHKLTYALKNKKTDTVGVTEVDAETLINLDIDFKETKLENLEWPYLKKEIYDFIFLAKEPIDNLKLFTGSHEGKELLLMETLQSKKIVQIN